MKIDKFHNELTNSFFDSYEFLNINKENLDITTVLSPHEISLPKSILLNAQKAISSIFSLRENIKYQNHVYTNENLNFNNIGNYSVLMSYDFHLDANECLKLIEINTNSAGYLFVDQLYKFKGNKAYAGALEDLKSSFLNESKQIKNIAIIDENLPAQKMISEFYMYNELFKKWGFNSEVMDFKSLSLNSKNFLEKDNITYDYIYNRYCDFLLDRTESSVLLKGFKENNSIFSPNPNEYLLLADKNRLIDWSIKNFFTPYSITESDISNINSILLESFVLNAKNKDDFWGNRKSFFIKPLRSHGSKRTYNGKSISKKVYNSLEDDLFLAQKTCPAKTIEINEDTWKYDLRFFTYKDQIQLVTARLYQGQLTNFSTLGGGFATVNFF